MNANCPPNASQEGLEARCRALYHEVKQFWLSNRETYATWELGYSILYSPPVYHPALVTIGENPGSLRGQIYSPAEHSSWPNHNVYYHDTWPLAKKLQALFSSIGELDALRDSVGFAVNFFRSRPSSDRDVGLRWRDNPPQIRRVLEEFAKSKALNLIRLLEPRLIVTLGMKAFDTLAGKPIEVLERRNNSRLCTFGYIENTPTIGMIHPTGSWVSNADWNRIMKHIRIKLHD